MKVKKGTLKNMSCSTCLESSSYDLENPIISIQCGHKFHKHCLPNNFLESKEKNCPKCRNKKKLAFSEPRNNHSALIQYGNNEKLSHYSTRVPPVRYKKRVEVSLAWRIVFWIFGVIFVFLTIIFAILDFLDDFATKRSKSLKSEQVKLENKDNKKRTLRFL